MLYGPGIDNFGVGLLLFEDGPLSLLSLPVKVGLLIPTSFLSLSTPSSVEAVSRSRSNIECAVSLCFKLVVEPCLTMGLVLPGRLGIEVPELPFL